MIDQRELYEAAVVERLKESGFLEIEIRTECLVRSDDGYQDEVINAGWHYWNAAVAAQSPAPNCNDEWEKRAGELRSAESTGDALWLMETLGNRPGSASVFWRELARIIRAIAGYPEPAPADPAPQPNVETLQARVQPWMMACFGPEISADKLERNDRFIEEALELVQASNYPKERALALVDYVYGRDQGEIHQEVGGVMITLAAHCLAHGVDMHQAGETELARIWTKVEVIRAKQAAKPTGSALPIAAAALEGSTDA